MLRSLLRRLRSERGSAALLIPVGALLFATAGALVVDVGLLLNDRRDAQASADAMALAGALELTLNGTDDAAVATQALLRAQEWGEANGLDLADPDMNWSTPLTNCAPADNSCVEVIRNCFTANDGAYSGVRVRLRRTPTIALLDYFGASWRSGATALACAGRPIDTTRFLPFAVSEISSCFTLVSGRYLPKLGERCNLQITNGTALNGQLGFQPEGDCPDGNPSADELRDNIINSVDVNCAIGQDVQAGPGNSVGSVRQGMSTRLASGHPCDTNSPVTAGQLTSWTATLPAPAMAPAAKNNNIDDLFEIWERNTSSANSADSLLPYDCDPSVNGIQTSPRNVNIVVVHDFTNADGACSQCYIVRGFVRMYIEGCFRSGTFYPNCNQGGGEFQIWARMVEQLGESGSTLGLSNYGDIGVFLKN